jgi:putative ABC transport system permease protein
MTALYRLALRFCLPDVSDRLEAEAVATVVALARDAAGRGHLALARYWVAEFISLARLGWRDRSQRKGSPMRSILPGLLRDVRYSLRLLARTPGVTVVALVTLALGIGANTAIFSIINGVLLKPLPYPDAGRLYLIQHGLVTDRAQLAATTPGNFYDIQQSVSTMRMAALTSSTITLTGHGDPERLQGMGSAGSVLAVLGVAPQLGRIFTEDDDRLGAPKTVVISDRLWRRVLDGRGDAIGQTLMLGGEPLTVIGVMPREFRFPDSETDLWAPAHLNAGLRASRTEYFLTILARLNPGATEAAARGELDAAMARLRTAFPQANGNATLEATPLADSLVANVSRLLWILMGSVGCVLLIACANLANLLLARATGRVQEIAIRQAIGADRGRIVRQLLVESVVLALLGGALGVAVGAGFLRGLVAWLPPGIPRIDEAAIDGPVLLLTFAAAAITGLFFGLAPALQLSRRTPAMVLRDDARTASSRSPLRAMLVVGELAVALVLLAGAGLLIRSFMTLQRVDPGFATDRILTFQVRMEGPQYGQAAARLNFVRSVVERLSALPGVSDAAASSTVPIAGRGTGAWFNLLARPWPPGTTPPGVPYRVITPSYFRTMQIPLVRGRLLDDRDGRGATPSVVISESVARRFWTSPADGDPVGSEIYLGAPDNKLFDRATIVGIVKDVKLAGLGGSLTDAVYGLHSLMPFWRAFSFAVRTSGNPTLVAADARSAVRQVDPQLAITGMQAMTDIMATSIAPTRASMLLLVLFAAVAMVMAAIGVFGVMSYAVTLRAREMGIRIALGAEPAEVRRMIVLSGLRQAGAGVVLGVAGALWLTRLLDSMLYGVRPADPATLATVSALLIAVAMLACYLPARRATRVDPVTILRA